MSGKRTKGRNFEREAVASAKSFEDLTYAGRYGSAWLDDPGLVKELVHWSGILSWFAEENMERVRSLELELGTSPKDVDAMFEMSRSNELKRRDSLASRMMAELSRGFLDKRRGGAFFRRLADMIDLVNATPYDPDEDEKLSQPCVVARLHSVTAGSPLRNPFPPPTLKEYMAALEAEGHEVDEANTRKLLRDCGIPYTRERPGRKPNAGRKKVRRLPR